MINTILIKVDENYLALDCHETLIDLSGMNGNGVLQLAEHILLPV